jgi:hypothetical protein
MMRALFLYQDCPLLHQVIVWEVPFYLINNTSVFGKLWVELQVGGKAILAPKQRITPDHCSGFQKVPPS